MNTSKITRKNFLKVTCGTSALMFLPGFFLNSCENDAAPNREADPSFIPDIEFELTAHRSDVSILPGAKTKVWKYSGKVISGRKDALQTLDDNYLGPIFRVKTGDKIRVRFKSELDEIMMSSTIEKMRKGGNAKRIVKDVETGLEKKQAYKLGGGTHNTYSGRSKKNKKR